MGLSGLLTGTGQAVSKVGEFAGNKLPGLKHAYERGLDQVKTYGDDFVKLVNKGQDEYIDPMVKFFSDKKNLTQTTKKQAIEEVESQIASLEKQVNTKNIDKLNQIENQINEYKQLRDELKGEYKTRYSAEETAQLDQNSKQVADVKYKLDEAKENKRLAISDEIAENEKKIASLEDDYKYQLDQTKQAQLSNNQKQLTLAEEKTREVANQIQKATDKTLKKLGDKYNEIDKTTKNAGIKFKLRSQIREVLDEINSVNPKAYDDLSKEFQVFIDKPDLTIDEIRTVMSRAEESANRLRSSGSSESAKILKGMRSKLREAQLKTYEDSGMKNIADELRATNAQYSKTANYRDYLEPNEVTRQIENQKELIKKVQSFRDYDPNLPLQDSNQFINEISQALPEQAPDIISQAKNVGQQLKAGKEFSPDLSVVQKPDVSNLQNTIDQLKRAKIKADILPDKSQAKVYQDLITEYQAQMNNLKSFKPDTSSKILSPDADLNAIDNQIEQLVKSKGDKIDVNVLEEYQNLLKQKQQLIEPSTKSSQSDKFMNLPKDDDTSINKWIKRNANKITDPLNEDPDSVEFKKLVSEYQKETGKTVSKDIETLVKDRSLIRTAEEGAQGISVQSIGGFKSLGQDPANMLGRAIGKLRKFNDPNAKVYESQIAEALRKGTKHAADALYFSLMQQPQFRKMMQEDKVDESKP
jgi:hypothetical protein